MGVGGRLSGVVEDYYREKLWVGDIWELRFPVLKCDRGYQFQSEVAN